MKRLLEWIKRGKLGMLFLCLLILWALVMGFSMLTDEPSPTTGQAKAKPSTEELGFQLAGSSPRRVAGFVETYEPRIEENKAELAKLEEKQVAAQVHLEELLERDREKTEIIRGLLQKLEEATHKEAAPAAPPSPESPTLAAVEIAKGLEGLAPGALVPNVPEPETQPPAEPTRLQKITLTLPPSLRPQELRIPAGAFAEGVLLTGCYAPVEGQALPIKIRLTSAFQAPNRARVPLGDAFLLGKAIGDANSERVIVQLTTLSYVHTSGRSIEVPVNGFISDSDGTQGAAGRYVWRAGELATYSAVAGGISGAADAVASTQTVTQTTPLGGAQQIVTGDVLKFAGAKGASRASDALNEVIVRRMQDIIPAIWVPNGRRITVCLIEGVTLPGLSPKEIDNDSSNRRPFSGLDLDR